MDVARWIGFAVGVVLVLAAAVSMGKTLIVPRATPGKISSVVTSIVRRIFLAISNRFDEYEEKDNVPRAPRSGAVDGDPLHMARRCSSLATG